MNLKISSAVEYQLLGVTILVPKVEISFLTLGFLWY